MAARGIILTRTKKKESEYAKDERGKKTRELYKGEGKIGNEKGRKKKKDAKKEKLHEGG